MKRFSARVLVIAVAGSLILGSVIGFLLGVASTRAGRAILANLVEQEERADTTNLKTFVRDQFQLQYPSNWRIDVDDRSSSALRRLRDLRSTGNSTEGAWNCAVSSWGSGRPSDYSRFARMV
jgi:hypothetical protein